MAQFAINAVYQNFIPKYFEGIGLTKPMIGALVGFSPFIAIVGQPVWGALADRVPRKRLVLFVLLLAAALAMVLYPLSPAYAYLMLMVGVNAFFYTSVQPLGDAITLEGLEKGGWKFGPLRMAGTVSFALVAAGAGTVLTGRTALVPYLTAALTAVAAAAVFVLPQSSAPRARSARSSVFGVLKSRDMILLLSALFLMMVTMAFYYAFFAVHFTTNLHGTSAMLGWCYFISAMSEVPFLLSADRLLERFGPGKMLVFSCAMLTLRWTTLSFMQNPYLVMASQVMHMGCLIVMSFTLVKTIALVMPPELKATGQMAASVIAMTASRVVGSALGGVLADAMGIQRVFLLCAGLCAAVLAALVIFLRKGYLQARPDTV